MIPSFIKQGLRAPASQIVVSLEVNDKVSVNTGSFLCHLIPPAPSHFRPASSSVSLTTSTIYHSVFQHPIHLQKPHSLRVHGLLAALTTLGDEKPPCGRQGLKASKPPGLRAVPQNRLQGAASGSVRPARRPWKPLEQGWEGPRRRGLSSDSR